MDIRAPEQLYNPYRIFTRSNGRALRDDTPMTLDAGEFAALRSMHDRLDLRRSRRSICRCRVCCRSMSMPPQPRRPTPQIASQTPTTAARVIITTSPSANGCRSPSRRTSYARVIEAMPLIHEPVPLGPRAYREQLRGSGPIRRPATTRSAGHCLAVVAARSHVVCPRNRRIPDRNFGCARAARGRGAAAIRAKRVSVAAIGQRGVVDGRRRDRGMPGDAGCRRHRGATIWREYVWLAAGVWLGVVLALGAVNLIFGRALF